MSTAAIGTEQARRQASARAPGGVLFATLVTIPLALLMSWPKIAAVWQTGTFFDTDDAMRMVQVRDWIAGQGWFDLTAHRMDPSSPVLLHWSRIVDLPLGWLVRIFSLFAAPEQAERLARLVFPLSLQAGMIAATAWVACILAGPRACLPAAFLLVLSGIVYGQFQPGRVDHHAPQILLLMLMTGTTLLSLDPRHAGKAALTGALVAVSLAISLENLPFLAVILLAPAIAWAVLGERSRSALMFFALGIGVAVPLMFAATVPPSRYTWVTCDAFALPHLCGLIAGVAALALLGAVSPALGTTRARWAALALSGAAVLTGLGLAFPSCLRGPYGDMDPLLRDLWLSHVTEAQPLLVAVRLRPATLTLLAIPSLLGALATVAACWRTRGLARARWFGVAALVAVGIAGTFWEVRVASTVQPLTVLGAAWLVAQSIRLAQRVADQGAGSILRQRALDTALPLGLVLGFSSLAWAFVPIGAMSDETRAELKGGAACREARALAPLAPLPSGLVFAPIDAGSHLLASTSMAVLGAPYHRNQRGNLLVLQGFLAAPDKAEQVVKATGARYVALCLGSVQTQVMAREAPDGLAARLVEGRVPDWLAPIRIENTPYRVYAVQ